MSLASSAIEIPSAPAIAFQGAHEGFEIPRSAAEYFLRFLAIASPSSQVEIVECCDEGLRTDSLPMHDQPKGANDEDASPTAAQDFAEGAVERAVRDLNGVGLHCPSGLAVPSPAALRFPKIICEGGA